jgi:hypothetical protein
VADDKKADADRIKWLTKEIWSNINCLDERAGFNTKKAFIVKIASIVLGTITTILIGIGHGLPADRNSEYVSIVALVTSAAVSGLAS